MKTEKISDQSSKHISVVSSERLALSEKFIQDLRVILNKVHNKDFSLRFWKFILKPYLTIAISSKPLWERTEVKSPPLLLPANPELYKTLKQRFETNLIRYIKFLTTYNKSAQIKKVLFNNSELTIGFPELKYSKTGLGEDLPISYPFFYGRKNVQKRIKANQIADEYTDLFSQNLVRQIPQIFLEYFDSILDSIPLFEPAKKIFHIHHLPNGYMDFIAAKYAEHGSKVYWYQHGGCYGEYTNHSSHKYEGDLADQFRTWGWKIKENDVPWKAYRLEKFKEDYTKSKEIGKYDCLICYTIINKENLEGFVSKTELFLNNIDSSKYKTFLARPRPISKTRSFKKKLNFITDPRVDKDNGLTPMAKVVKKCKIVIQMEIPSTNYLECIYVDHPVIGYFTNTEQPSEITKPFYNFLIEKGVFHTSFESLIAHLNNIDVNTWWSELIAHPEYISFKNTFARKV